jgi:hypothetical protein
MLRLIKHQLFDLVFATQYQSITHLRIIYHGTEIPTGFIFNHFCVDFSGQLLYGKLHVHNQKYL